ncbi:hypothetical protein D9M71_626790 [compost metagenome]
MAAQQRQHGTVALNRIDVIDQALAQAVHLHQVLVVHGPAELQLDLAGHLLDDPQVAQVVMHALGQHRHQHFQRRAHAGLKVHPGEQRVAGTDHHQASFAEHNAERRHVEHPPVEAFRALPDQEQVVGLDLDARHFIWVQRGFQSLGANP